MVKGFRKFMKLVNKTQMDSSKLFIVQKYNWSLSNYQYWTDTKTPVDGLELIYDDKAGHIYQAIINTDGSLSINGEGHNKRMDKMLRKFFS